jgi:hypothetical protein
MSRDAEGAQVHWRELRISKVLREVGGGDPNKITNLEKGLQVRRSDVALGTALCPAQRRSVSPVRQLRARAWHLSWYR